MHHPEETWHRKKTNLPTSVTDCCHTIFRDLRIENFRPNRISNRIGGYDSNSNRISNRNRG